MHKDRDFFHVKIGGYLALIPNFQNLCNLRVLYLSKSLSQNDFISYAVGGGESRPVLFIKALLLPTPNEVDLFGKCGR